MARTAQQIADAILAKLVKQAQSSMQSVTPPEFPEPATAPDPSQQYSLYGAVPGGQLSQYSPYTSPRQPMTMQSMATELDASSGQAAVDARQQAVQEIARRGDAAVARNIRTVGSIRRQA